MRNALAITALLMNASYAAEQPPNVVIVLADDLGYGSVGCYGANPELVKTPHIDRLATEGVRFTDASTPASVCTPTRYGLLTGRYCWRSRLKKGVVNVFDPLLVEPDRQNLARLMQSKGYETAIIGKWHLGYGIDKRIDFTKELKPGPLELGFDYQFAVPQNNGDLTGVYVENHKVVGLRSSTLKNNMPKTFYGSPYLGLDAPQRDEPRNMPVLADKAVAWIERVPKDKPFFLYFAATAIHEPVWPSPEVKGKTAGGDYTDFIMDLDVTVRKLMDAVKKKGVDENTVFLFTSDNGGVIPAPNSPRNPSIKEAQSKGLKINGDLKGGKHGIHEGGFRVPFIVRWPGRIKAGSTCDQMVNLVDVYATVNDILGASKPDQDKGAEDSVSFLAQLKDPATSGARESMILHSANGQFAIRQGKWKLVEGLELYNLEEDLKEQRNLLKTAPEVAARLQAKLNSIRGSE